MVPGEFPGTFLLNFIAICGILLSKKSFISARVQRVDSHVFPYGLSAPAEILTGGKDLELLEKLKDYGVDVEAAVARFVGKKDLYTKFLMKFLDDTNFNGLLESIENQKYPEAFEYAHSLKGVCGNLNLSPLTEQVTELTEILRNKESLSGEEQQRIQDIMPVMTKSYEDIIRILEENK